MLIIKMALQSCFCKTNGHEFQGQGKARILAWEETARRRIFLSSTAATLLLASTLEANDSRTTLIQKYLKKSAENKAKNDKERLDNYYKRNYKDYFGFVEGTLQAKDKEELSESERGILEWLEKNK